MATDNLADLRRKYLLLLDEVNDLQAKHDKLVEALKRVRGDLIRQHSPFVYDQNFSYIDEAVAECEGDNEPV